MQLLIIVVHVTWQQIKNNLVDSYYVDIVNQTAVHYLL